MSWLLLITGLALWYAAHLFKRASPHQRTRLGAAGKGLVSLVLLAAIGLLISGYRAVPYTHVWYPPSFLIYLNNLLIFIAIFMMNPVGRRGWLLHRMRHPMLVGFALWAGAHPLVNGDLAAIVRFGCFLAWGVVEMIVINHAEPHWQAGKPGTWAMDALFLVASALLMGAIGLLHAWLGYWPFPR